MAKIWEFESTGAAYDACQCDEAIKDGDTLLIKAEQVVGIAGCWPVAVTAECGHFHRKADGAWWAEIASYEAVTQARRIAREHGFEWYSATQQEG